jgi:hypothetical protein
MTATAVRSVVLPSNPIAHRVASQRPAAPASALARGPSQVLHSRRAPAQLSLFEPPYGGR